MTDETGSGAIRVLCADDHPLVRKGIAAIVANEPDMQLVAEAENGEAAVEMYRKHRPDVVLMDLRMPMVDGITAVQRIRAEFPGAKILALTSYDGDHDIFRALDAGVAGYLLKDMVHTEVVPAIRVVNSGRRMVPPEVARRLGESVLHETLTPREVEVLSLVAKGLANKEIGAKLGTASGTIKMHVQNILAKLNASDRTHAVTIAIQRGIIRL